MFGRLAAKCAWGAPWIAKLLLSLAPMSRRLVCSCGTKSLPWDEAGAGAEAGTEPETNEFLKQLPY